MESARRARRLGLCSQQLLLDREHSYQRHLASAAASWNCNATARRSA
jgi:hypothetical protein